ncbi:hypothetical protein BpHYR1_035159 [Brachionus plicatilis]|uniref:Uncharacterized protein n=1 Tax=Brachionus plicatilis TaxID=10195 RepID=A0A3M7SE87_BRAPC|nr:hypothetical protein BpHYR1_035159 [Brachionus plicatilis]
MHYHDCKIIINSILMENWKKCAKYIVKHMELFYLKFYYYGIFGIPFHLFKPIRIKPEQGLKYSKEIKIDFLGIINWDNMFFYLLINHVSCLEIPDLDINMGLLNNFGKKRFYIQYKRTEQSS